MSNTTTVRHHYTRILPALGWGLIFVFAITARWWSVRQNHVFFHFDQARDAFIAQQIYRDHDWKIQGPSASGTNETVYHGVLFYYVIAPLYGWFAGDPARVTQALAVLGASILIPLYLLSRELTKSVFWSCWVCLLAAGSLESIHTSTWLSNPSLVLPLSCWFYLALWKVFYAHQRQWWPVLALTLGLNHQAVVVMIFLWVSLFWSAWFQKKSRPQTTWPLTQLLGFGLIYGISISSMILVQLRLAHQGIFTWQALSTAAGTHPEHALSSVQVVAELFIRKSILSFLPSWPVASLLGVGWVVWTTRQAPLPAKSLLRLWWLAPLGLLAFHSRGAYHALIGLELPLYLALALWLSQTIKKPLTLISAGSLILLTTMILGSQYLALASFFKQGIVTYSIERNITLNNQLQVVDRSYQAAQRQPFSLTTLTNPYRYNMTWAYLFSWYGQQHYDYVPGWAGNSQIGTAWENALPHNSSNLPRVAISEDVTGLEPWMKTQFIAEQPSATPSSELVVPGFTWHFFAAPHAKP